MDHKAPHKKGGLFQLEFTNTFQLKQGLKELKRKRNNNNNKENSWLNKSNVVSSHLNDFHGGGIGGSFWSSFYLGIPNGREGMSQLKVRLLGRHICVAWPHSPKKAGWGFYVPVQTESPWASCFESHTQHTYCTIPLNLPDVCHQPELDREQVTAGWKAPEKKTLREREKVQGDLCNLSLRRLGFRERLQGIKD